MNTTKNGQLGYFLYKLFQDHRGTLKELYLDIEFVERDKLMNRLNRELNPDDDGAKLGIGTVEDLLVRLSRHKALSKVAPKYLEDPLRKMAFVIHREYRDTKELNGYIDDDAFEAIYAIARPGMARVPVESMTEDEKLRYLGYFKTAEHAIAIGIQELKHSLFSDERDRTDQSDNESTDQ